jgi:tRNA G18 (ribose-2'-O)-methylase SpoU
VAPTDPESPLRLPFRATVASARYDALGTLPVVVLLDNVRSLYNVGAFFRTADAVGIDRLLLSGITASPPHRGLAKTALGAEERVRWETAPDAVARVADLREAGYQVVAVETGPTAIDLFEWQPAFPVCVVFGHEVDGVRRELLEAVDALVRVPMRGTKHSLNVATAGGVVLYELLRKYRAMAAR